MLSCGMPFEDNPQNANKESNWERKQRLRNRWLDPFLIALVIVVAVWATFS